MNYSCYLLLTLALSKSPIMVMIVVIIKIVLEAVRTTKHRRTLNKIQLSKL